MNILLKNNVILQLMIKFVYGRIIYVIHFKILIVQVLLIHQIIQLIMLVKIINLVVQLHQT
jgi:hypothetical protein